MVITSYFAVVLYPEALGVVTVVTFKRAIIWCVLTYFVLRTLRT